MFDFFFLFFLNFTRGRKKENPSLILMMPVQSGTWTTWSIMLPTSVLVGWQSVGCHFFLIVLGWYCSPV